MPRILLQRLLSRRALGISNTLHHHHHHHHRRQTNNRHLHLSPHRQFLSAVLPRFTLATAATPATPSSESGAMAQPTLKVSPADGVLNLILSSYPYLNISREVSDTPQAPSKLVLSNTETIAGSNTVLTYLSDKIFPKITYTPTETAEINQWLTLSTTQLESDTPSFLKALNEHLKLRNTVLGTKFSVADIALLVRLSPIAKALTPEERTGGPDGGWRYIVRYLDYIQNSPELGLRLTADEKIAIDVNNVITKVRVVEAPKEKKGAKGKAEEAAVKTEGKVEKAKEKAGEKVVEVREKVKEAAGAVAGAATGGKAKKEKKPKEKKPAPPKKEEAPLSPALLDLRVGHILYCMPHPEADGLYISTISALDPADSPYITALPSQYCPAEKIPEGTTVRTVCSGLRKFIPLEEMQDRKVVLVANLKPANLRGVKSQAMVLAASPVDGKEIVELVNPPADAPVGAPLVFEGYEEGEPEAQLNPKKKIMETLTPGLGTNEEKVVVFNGAKVPELGSEKLGRLVLKDKGAEGGLCTVPTLAVALVK